MANFINQPTFGAFSYIYIHITIHYTIYIPIPGFTYLGTLNLLLFLFTSPPTSLPLPFHLPCHFTSLPLHFPPTPFTLPLHFPPTHLPSHFTFPPTSLPLQLHFPPTPLTFPLYFPSISHYLFTSPHFHLPFLLTFPSSNTFPIYFPFLFPLLLYPSQCQSYYLPLS